MHGAHTDIGRTGYKKQWVQDLSVFRGKCLEVLLDKMEYDPDWYKASNSYGSLQLLNLFNKTVLDQTKDQYPFSMVYKQ